MFPFERESFGALCAPDFVRAMWMMLQLPEPVDLVISTAEQHSVREFAELAFAAVDLD